MNLFSTVLAAAQNTQLQFGTGGAGINVGNPSSFTIQGILGWVITIVVVVAGLIFFFMLIIGGLQWVLSGGDKAATEAARGRITAALIGLVIIFSAWAIAILIENIFGVSILAPIIPQVTTG